MRNAPVTARDPAIGVQSFSRKLIHNSAVEFTFFVDDRDPLETTLLMKLHQGKTKVAKGSVLKAAHVADEKGLA